MKGHHFDANEVTEAKLQALLNTQDEFKHGRRTGNNAIAEMGST
jgi:hypothetical protein